MQKIKSLIDSGKSFLVVSHMDPEGDAIASTLAVANYLLEKGKNVTAYNRDPVPQNLLFLEGSDLITGSLDPDRAYDVTFVLDCSDFSRISGDFPPKRRSLGKLINIDHHLTSKGLGDVNVIDADASSTSELIYLMFKSIGGSVSLKVAEALYAAILTDTGSFRYSNSSPRAFRIASELVALGVSPWKVAQALYEDIPAAKLKLTSLVLSTLEIFEDEKFASVTLTKEMLEKAGALPEFSDGLINYPRSIRNVEVAIIIKEIGSEDFKIGLRSKGRVDVAKIASGFGGGGHKNAAGCGIKGKLARVKAELYQRVRNAVREYSRNNPDK